MLESPGFCFPRTFLNASLVAYCDFVRLPLPTSPGLTVSMLLSFNHWMPFLSSLNLFSSSQHPAAGSLSAPQSTGPMLRVLCVSLPAICLVPELIKLVIFRLSQLHGYHGSGPTLKSQMAGVAGTFAHNGYELVFADTPSLRAGTSVG